MSHQNEPRYQIRTARNEVLPPISLEELKKWVREGRVSPESDRITQVGSGVWGKMQDYPELGYNAAAARTEIDAELAKTRRVRVALLLSFIIPAAILSGCSPCQAMMPQRKSGRQNGSPVRLESMRSKPTIR